MMVVILEAVVSNSTAIRKFVGSQAMCPETCSGVSARATVKAPDSEGMVWAAQAAMRMARDTRTLFILILGNFELPKVLTRTPNDHYPRERPDRPPFPAVGFSEDHINITSSAFWRCSFGQCTTTSNDKLQKKLRWTFPSRISGKTEMIPKKIKSSAKNG